MDFSVLESEVIFHKDSPFNICTANVKQTPFHLHNDILEIVLVLKGAVFAHVSFESFYLYPGDYIAINAGDPHFIQDANISISDEIAIPATTENGEKNNRKKKIKEDPLLLTFYFDLKKYNDVNKYLKYILFTLESFDLARYKHQENLIRNKLSDIALHLIANKESKASDLTISLLTLLTREYTSQNYYNRNAYITEMKLEKYFNIISDMSDYYYKKNILDFLSKKENYSKSYISHLFKEIGTTSFSDMLIFYRVANAEKMLLATDQNLFDIAYECGFSDTKYLIKDFQNWFNLTPGKYRKYLKPFVKREEILQKVDIEKTKKELEHLKIIDTENENQRFSVNPISLKII